MRNLFLAVIFCAACVDLLAQNVYIFNNDSSVYGVGIDKTRRTVLEHNADDANGLCLMLPDGRHMGLEHIDSCVVKVFDLPTLWITFPGNEGLDWVVDKENYLPAAFRIDGNGQTDDYAEFEGNAKGRGNSTWGFQKKPMRIKLPSKKSLFGMAKAKNYVLLANYIDPSHIKNTLAHWLARELGVSYSCHTQSCNVYVNGRYAGLYVMTEKIGINKASVDIDETKGMLFEISSEFDEPYKFRSKYWNLPVMVKDPDLDELYGEGKIIAAPENYLSMWEADFEEMERKVDDDDLSGIDIESAAKYILLYNVVKNDELGHPKSCCIHKEALGDGYKYIFGPGWDFDLAFNYKNGTDKGFKENNPYEKLSVHGFFKALAANREFQKAYAAEFENFEKNVYPRMLEFLDSEGKRVEYSALRDGWKWPDIVKGTWLFREPSKNHGEVVEGLREWLHKRVSYLRKRIDCGSVL